jgi:hypothetical protein
VLFPEHCHPDTVVRFAQHLADQLQYSDYVLTISARVDRDLKDLAHRLLGRSVTSQVIPLGADFPAASPMSDAAFAAAFPALDGLRFMLGVGTIEPRKNHALLLDMFDRLKASDLGLVIVGRQGWMAEEVVARLASHPHYGKRLFWHEGLEDTALAALYARALVSVFPSTYEGYGLPPAEALSHGAATVCSDGGALPEATGGHAEIFRSDDAEALFAILDQLYSDGAYHQRLRDMAAAYVGPTWSDATARVEVIVNDMASGAGHDFARPVRQMVLLSVHPEVLDLALRSVRENLPWIERVVVLTKIETRAAIKAIVGRYFADSVILTDDEVLGADVATTEHTPRNTWLRKLLYRHGCIEPNFVAADEDYLTLRPLGADYFQTGTVHVGRYFLEDMGTWLAGSPTMTSYDHGIRNAWRLLREAGYPARAFSSHVPQIINKNLVNQIYDRFVADADHAWLDEWSLYFNVAAHLFPANFRFAPYATLGWPMRLGDWFPQIEPAQPLFENYYPQNYAAGGMFEGLAPGGDVTAKEARLSAALARARRIERDGQGAAKPGQFVLSVAPSGLASVGGTVIAGRSNVRRILLLNGTGRTGTEIGQLEMFLADANGALVRGEAVTLGEVCWLPLVPPERPGRYRLRFFATLDTGARLETTAPLDVVADAAEDRP